MDICKLCSKEKAGAVSCVVSRIVIEGRNYHPVPFKAKSGEDFAKGASCRCPECHVQNGGMHHVGCSLEICPRCSNRWIFCRCNGTKLRLSEAPGDINGDNIVRLPNTSIPRKSK